MNLFKRSSFSDSFNKIFFVKLTKKNYPNIFSDFTVRGTPNSTEKWPLQGQSYPDTKLPRSVVWTSWNFAKFDVFVYIFVVP